MALCASWIGEEDETLSAVSKSMPTEMGLTSNKACSLSNVRLAVSMIH
jgi:hypothetical protein